MRQAAAADAAQARYEASRLTAHAQSEAIAAQEAERRAQDQAASLALARQLQEEDERAARAAAARRAAAPAPSAPPVCAPAPAPRAEADWAAQKAGLVDRMERQLRHREADIEAIRALGKRPNFASCLLYK